MRDSCNRVNGLVEITSLCPDHANVFEIMSNGFILVIELTY